MYPQDVEYGLFEGNPLAGLIEGFRLAPAAGGELEAWPVVHVQLRRGVRLSAVEADRLAKTCQYGVQRHLAAAGGDVTQAVDMDPSANGVAIELHPYGTGPFTEGGPVRR
ncbi:coenzyme f390 synthetase [Streptomyces piniterrae]|uniref:coenzyme f390 synthetase n=1 Tax=Streptomyces piniterrae TaxID=2571125 RepID=UPI001FE70867|nr:coenzyme f390 synthetase [Streptomyces piniterrae]